MPHYSIQPTRVRCASSSNHRHETLAAPEKLGAGRARVTAASGREIRHEAGGREIIGAGLSSGHSDPKTAPMGHGTHRPCI